MTSPYQPKNQQIALAVHDSTFQIGSTKLDFWQQNWNMKQKYIKSTCKLLNISLWQDPLWGRLSRRAGCCAGGTLQHISWQEPWTICQRRGKVLWWGRDLRLYIFVGLVPWDGVRSLGYVSRCLFYCFGLTRGRGKGRSRLLDGIGIPANNLA